MNLAVESSRQRLEYYGSDVGDDAVSRPASPPPSLTDGGPLSATPMPIDDLKAARIPTGVCGGTSARRLPVGELRTEIAARTRRVGVVFKAYEPSLNRFIALKMLARNWQRQKRHNNGLRAEARAAAAIQHENVVAIYAVREAAGTPYLAMEYVDGSCLETRIQQHGPMPIMLIVETARQIASGLAAARTRGVVHRDIKPANILIENATGKGKALRLRLGACHRRRNTDGGRFVDWYAVLHGPGDHSRRTGVASIGPVQLRRGDVHDGDRPRAVPRSNDGGGRQRGQLARTDPPLQLRSNLPMWLVGHHSGATKEETNRAIPQRGRCAFPPLDGMRRVKWRLVSKLTVGVESVKRRALLNPILNEHLARALHSLGLLLCRTSVVSGECVI